MIKSNARRAYIIHLAESASLRDGPLPASQKYAIVSPLLKKPFLDPAELWIELPSGVYCL